MKATITKTRLALLPACVIGFILSSVHSSIQGAPAVMESKEVIVAPGSDITIPIRFADVITHWRVQVTAADNWRHGSQKNEWGAAWTWAFGAKVGSVSAAGAGWYAQWAQTPDSKFHGTLVRDGEGTGGEAKYQLTRDVGKPSGYMILPDRLYAAVGDPEGITLTAWIGDGEGLGAKEPSNWSAVADITFDPNPAENTDTVKVTASEPGVYTIEGTSTDQTTLTDSVELTLIRVELEVKERARRFNDIIKDRLNDKREKNYIIAFHKAGNNTATDLQLVAPGNAGNFQYEIIDSNGTVTHFGTIPVGSTVNINNLSLFDTKDYDYKIRYGVDVNGDGSLQIGEITSWDGSIFTVYGIREDEYTGLASGKTIINAALAVSVTSLGQVTHLSYQLAYRFVNGSFNTGLFAPYDDYIPIAAGNKSVSVDDITHRFGFLAGAIAGNNVTLPFYKYADGTKGSDYIEGHPDVQTKAQAVYNAITYAEVDGAYIADGLPITLSSKELGLIDFGFKSYALGHATPKGSVSFKATKISPTTYEISDFSIDMAVDDIFDFWYNNPKAAISIPGVGTIHFPKEAASVQCGHGVCGNTEGQVICVTVVLKKPFTFPNRSVSP